MKDCIETTYFRHPRGYAYKWDPEIKKCKYHHRYVWEQHNGPIPPNKVIRHKCDNPSCINIDHLEIGTIQDNNNDMLVRGRRYSKLTAEDVKHIRNIKGQITQRELAKMYNVTVSTIEKIYARKLWKHI